MSNFKLLKPRPMIAVEECVIFGRQSVDTLEYRRCSVCGHVLCWVGKARSENAFGVEGRPCGSRRRHASDESARPLVEYRCRRHVTRSWMLFGADWAVIRPLAAYV